MKVLIILVVSFVLLNPLFPMLSSRRLNLNTSLNSINSSKGVLCDARSVPLVIKTTVHCFTFLLTVNISENQNMQLPRSEYNKFSQLYTPRKAACRSIKLLVRRGFFAKHILIWPCFMVQNTIYGHACVHNVWKGLMTRLLRQNWFLDLRGKSSTDKSFCLRISKLTKSKKFFQC